MAGSGRFESEGAFTLDASNLKAKLGQFTLPSPELFLCKLIQAGIAADSTQVEVSHGRRLVRVDFRQPSSFGDLHAVMAALENPLAAGHRALRHLGQGLAASLRSHRSARLVLTTGRGACLLEAHPKRGLRATTVEDCPVAPGDCRFELSKPWYGGLTTRKEGSALERHRWSPVPVFVDGQPLQAVWPRPESLCDAYLPNESGLRVKLPDGDTYRRLDLVYLRQSAGTPLVLDLFGWPFTPARAGLAIRLPIELKGPSRIHLVSDGLSLEAIVRHDLGLPGVEAFAMVENPDTDLTGFAPRESDYNAAHLRRIQSVTWGVVQRLLALLEERSEWENLSRLDPRLTTSLLGRLRAILKLARQARREGREA